MLDDAYSNGSFSHGMIYEIHVISPGLLPRFSVDQTSGLRVTSLSGGVKSTHKHSMGPWTTDVLSLITTGAAAEQSPLGKRYRYARGNSRR